MRNYCCNKKCPSSYEGRCMLGHQCIDKKHIEKIEFEFTGDELDMLYDIKNYIPYNKKVLWKWVNKLEDQIKEQIKGDDKSDKKI